MISGNIIMLTLVCLVAMALSSVFAHMTREITFFGRSTDNEKQARAAALLRLGQWPSTIHDHAFTDGRAAMKVFFVVMLAVVQRLLRDRGSERSLVMLCAAANALSAVLIFLIASTYWNAAVALLIAALFLASLWPWLLALHGGPICVSQTCFLASVYCLQLAGRVSPPVGLIWYGLAGIAAGLTQFSSGSARKYLPLFAGAFLYSQRNVVSFLGQPPVGGGAVFLNGVSLGVLTVAGVLGVGLLIARLGYKRAVTAAYFNRSPQWLNAAIRARATYDLQHYLDRARGVVRFATTLYRMLVLYLVLCLALSQQWSFYASQLMIALGVGCASLWLTYPNVLENVRRYVLYANADKWRARFPEYRRFFAKLGKSIPADMRGAGFHWLIRYFRCIAPFESLLYVVCCPLVALMGLQHGWEAGKVLGILSVFVLSLSPVAVAELTRAPQLGRFYFPSLSGLLLFIGYTVFQMDQFFGWQRLAFWCFSVGVVLLLAGRSAWAFLTDVWPARMAPAWLDKKLSQLGITTFSTYETPYNDAFVDSLRLESRQRYHIEFIRGLDEVRTGYVVVPGTSAKAFNMESQKQAIEHGDFAADPLLTRLLETREIARYAVASFKTFGTSRFWVHESEVMSYRDLILGEISERDRWRGLAWLLDAEKLQADRSRVRTAEDLMTVTAEKLA